MPSSSTTAGRVLRIIGPEVPRADRRVEDAGRRGRRTSDAAGDLAQSGVEAEAAADPEDGRAKAGDALLRAAGRLLRPGGVGDHGAAS